MSQPYFALETLSWSGTTFYASAAADLPLGLELGPMSGAEISRHAAIAGLCAAALSQQDNNRRFYLAQRADYVNIANPAPYGSRVAFEAKLERLNKRGACSQITVTAADAPLARLEVEYTILTEYAFKRLFRTRYRPTRFQAEMDVRLPGRQSVRDRRALHELAALPEAACAGHFTDYPALPVAILMGQLGATAASLMNAERIRGVRVSIDATDLCWAGERVRFEAAHADTQPEDACLESFACRVVAEDRVVCTANCDIEAHG